MIENQDEDIHGKKANYDPIADKTPRSDIQGPNESDYMKLNKNETKGKSKNNNDNNELEHIKDLTNVKMIPSDIQKNNNQAEEIANQIEKEFTKPPFILQGRPSYLEIKPCILQTPRLQLFGNVNNLAVCPFCKYTGAMDISYKRSTAQMTLCLILALTLVCLLCCWVPLIIRALSDQVYSCSNCKKVLMILPRSPS